MIMDMKDGIFQQKEVIFLTDLLNRHWICNAPHFMITQF